MYYYFIKNEFLLCAINVSILITFYVLRITISICFLSKSVIVLISGRFGKQSTGYHYHEFFTRESRSITIYYECSRIAYLKCRVFTSIEPWKTIFLITVKELRLLSRFYIKSEEQSYYNMYVFFVFEANICEGSKWLSI